MKKEIGLRRLHRKIKKCKRCSLWRRAKRAVPGEGSVNAKNRKPKEEELKACKIWWQKQVEIIRPSALLCPHSSTG